MMYTPFNIGLDINAQTLAVLHALNRTDAAELGINHPFQVQTRAYYRPRRTQGHIVLTVQQKGRPMDSDALWIMFGEPSQTDGIFVAVWHTGWFQSPEEGVAILDKTNPDIAFTYFNYMDVIGVTDHILTKIKTFTGGAKDPEIQN